MDSDESGHSQSEFYYPEEETLNQMTPINRDEVEQERHLNNIQDFIYSLRPDNTKKKTTYDLNIWRRFCSTYSWRDESLGKYSSRRAKHTSVQVFHGRP